MIWFLYSFLAGLKNNKIKFIKHLKQSFNKNGFVDIGSISNENIIEIKNIVERYFYGEKSYQALPREPNNQLANYIFNILCDFKNEISSIMGSNFQTSFIEVIKTKPSSNENKDSSFAWHYDDEPRQMIKLFIYLNDTNKNNGAFRTFDNRSTRKLFAQKFISNTRSDRIRSQDLISKKITKNLLGLKEKQVLFFALITL